MKIQSVLDAIQMFHSYHIKSLESTIPVEKTDETKDVNKKH
jgi:hypothetical protein